ncbi:MAG: hypothetical protein IKR40_12525 [Treponema sp.]|nr:hypothetical protein [Treponema sp.]
MKANIFLKSIFMLIFTLLVFSCAPKNQEGKTDAASQNTQQTSEEEKKNPNREKIDEYFKGLTKIVIRAENNNNPDSVEKLTTDFNAFTDSYPNISDLPEWTDEDTDKQLELIDRFVDSTIPPTIYDENEDDLDVDSDDFDPFAESNDDLGLDDELNYGNATLLDKDDF